MTLSQTAKVPDDRWLKIKVPQEIPTGSTARFNVVWFPQVEKSDLDTTLDKSTIKEDGKIHFTRKEWEELEKDCPHTQALCGILAGMGNITKEEIREMRLREKYGEYFE